MSRLFMSATPPRITAARRPYLLILVVEHVLEAARIHEQARNGTCSPRVGITLADEVSGSLATAEYRVAAAG